MIRYGTTTSVLLLALTLAAHGASETPVLMNAESLTEQAPDRFGVKLETSRGEIFVDVHRDWAPRGADRFYNLVKNGFFDDTRFFRVVPNFVVQFGLSGDSQISKVWSEARIKDDPVKGSNTKGTLSFATAGPNTRTTQIFINLKDNARLDEMGFSPFAEVTEGMEVVARLFAGYGDGMNQQMIQREGNAWLDENFPKLDRLIRATVVLPTADDAEKPATE